MTRKKLQFKENMDKKTEKQLWDSFAHNYKLSPQQLDQFKRYYLLLTTWNKRINLTTITDYAEVIAYHFEDALKLGDFIDFSQHKMLLDVGTGGGIPGIPLKIKYPHLKVILIEVVQKKVDFLELVIKELGLENIEVSLLDWRTFLRKTDHPADIVCARASLRPDELVRMFKPASACKDALLVYWAANDWQVPEAEQKFFMKKEHYAVGDKLRNYIFFEKN
jgi:16S rRNA (guanine527-N7)-methyltransferase